MFDVGELFINFCILSFLESIDKFLKSRKTTFIFHYKIIFTGIRAENNHQNINCSTSADEFYHKFETENQ